MNTLIHPCQPDIRDHTLARLFSLALLLLAGVPLAGAARIELLRPEAVPAERLKGQWDARANNMIYIVNHDWEGSLFGLHVFEDLVVPTDGSRRFSNNRIIDAGRFAWTPDGDGWKFHIRQDEVARFELRGSLHPDGNAVRFTADITNLGQDDWVTSCEGLMCLRGSFSPDFTDPTGERIFVLDRQGKEHRVLDAAGIASDYFRFPVWRDSDPYQPPIIKRDARMARSIEMSARPCLSLAGNRELALSSVHANFQLQVPAGQTRRLEARIVFKSPFSWRSGRLWTAIFAGVLAVASLAAYLLNRPRKMNA